MDLSPPIPVSYYISRGFVYVAFDFAVNLTEGGSQCCNIATAFSTGPSPQIATSFIQYSSHFPVSNLAVVFKTASDNMQYGGLDVNCSRYNRLGRWPSEFDIVSGSRTTCTILEAPLDLLSGFTQVCIRLATNDSSCDRSSKTRKMSSYYHHYVGQLVISGFGTNSTTRAASFQSPCKVYPEPIFEPQDSSPAVDTLGTYRFILTALLLIIPYISLLVDDSFALDFKSPFGE